MTTQHSQPSIGRRAARRGFLLLLACFAAVVVSIPTQVRADNNGNNDQALYTGTISGTIPAALGPPVPGTGGCVFSFSVPNSGNATVLGNFTGTSNLVPNLCDGSNTGTFTWVAANGDRITGSFMGQLFPTETPGVFNNVQNGVITGGTGRFRRATGMYNTYGQVNFNTGTFVLPFLGTISTNGH